jgi:putative heme iron utilization protein
MASTVVGKRSPAETDIPKAPMFPDAPFDPRQASKKLVREARSGALATLMYDTGGPYCSLVNVATIAAGAPLLLISGLALHTKNLLADPRVSLMLDERKAGDPLEGARVMLMGRAVSDRSPEARRRYLARQPEAAAFADFKDFAFYRIEIERAHLVAGFGRIVDLTPADLLIDTSEAGQLMDSEAAACAHMNQDHSEAVRLYATQLLRAEDGPWQCVGCDPEGLELQLGRTALRLAFPQPVNAPDILRQMLKQLADQARGSR